MYGHVMLDFLVVSDTLERCKSMKTKCSIDEFTTEPNGVRSLFLFRQYAECFR